MPASPAVDVIRGADQAAVLLHPTRLRMLGQLAEPNSAAGLARRLGLPRQKVNYHLRELEKGGFIQPVEERRKGNCVERIVRASARSYLISPEVLGDLASDPAAFQDRFSASYLVAVAARAIRDLAVLRDRAARAGKRLASLTLETEVRFANTADRNAFAEELANTVAKLTARYHDEAAPGGRTFRVFLGAYPKITRPDDEPPSATKERDP